MAAPTFVKKKQLFVGGGTATPDAVSFASAASSGNLLILEVTVPNATTVATPTGWTRDVNHLSAGASNGLSLYAYHKTSAGETTVNVTVSDFNANRTYNMLEYAGLTTATLENAAVSRLDGPPSPGYGIMPAVPYGAGPRVVLGIVVMAGPGGTDVVAALAPYTLRTPVIGTDTFKSLATADDLLDTTAGTVASAGIFTNTEVGALMCVGLVYKTGVAGVVCSFTGTPTTGAMPLTVTYTDTSTGGADTWHWDFGDGSTSTSQDPTHVYTTPGDYTVALTASSGGSPPAAPGPGSTIVGLHMGPYNLPAVAKSCVDYVRLATPNHGGENGDVASYLAGGLGVILCRVGPYGAGVSSLDLDAWAAAAVAAYAAHPTILAIEILNEPGGEWFWGGSAMVQANATAYALLVKKTRDAFTAHGSAPLLLASYDGGHPGGTTWGTRVHTGDASVWTYVDGVTVHPYGGTSDPTASALGLRAAALAAASTTGKPVWITEVGWPTAVGQPATGDSLQWTETQQANNVYNFVTWALAQATVKGVIYFSYQDYGTNNYYGITRAGGAHKKSFADLRLAAVGSPQS